jgi:hypothetical protein
VSRRLVFVHGRSQEHKDAAALKGEWLTALRFGLAKTNLDLPIPESSVRLPYYGQTLRDLVDGVASDRVADVLVRSGLTGGDPEEDAMARQIVAEIREHAGLTDEQLDEVAGIGMAARAPSDPEWVRCVLRAIDRYVPFGSGGAVALFTRDVFRYLRNPGMRDEIEAGVRRALEPAVPTVVVGHSLGSVVAYNLLRREGATAGWEVPLFVTVGSPLAVTAIKRSLAPIHYPTRLGDWYNALDKRDIVALRPLTPSQFPVERTIENYTDVQNPTTNRHGISGYLEDEVVARRIHTALTT